MAVGLIMTRLGRVNVASGNTFGVPDAKKRGTKMIASAGMTITKQFGIVVHATQIIRVTERPSNVHDGRDGNANLLRPQNDIWPGNVARQCNVPCGLER